MDQPIIVDSNYYIGHLRRGMNPFVELERIAEDWELATCGMIMLEVQRGLKTERIRVLTDCPAAMPNRLFAQDDADTAAPIRPTTHPLPAPTPGSKFLSA